METVKKPLKPQEIARKMNISEQAVHKKIRNTLLVRAKKLESKNIFPAEFDIIENRTYVVMVPLGYKFVRMKKKKG